MQKDSISLRGLCQTVFFFSLSLWAYKVEGKGVGELNERSLLWIDYSKTETATETE